MEFGELNIESLTERFRPNLVLSTRPDVPPYAEEQWEMVKIGKAQFKVRSSHPPILTCTLAGKIISPHHWASIYVCTIKGTENCEYLVSKNL